MEQLLSKLWVEMKRAQAIQSEQSNKSRTPREMLQVGDKVWMDARNLSIAWPSKKLDWKCIGPNKVTEVVSPWVYRIKLPSQLSIHDIQPISHLENAAQDTLPHQQHKSPPPVIVDQEQEYEVEQINNSRMFWRQLQYLLKWKGYDEQS